MTCLILSQQVMPGGAGAQPRVLASGSDAGSPAASAGRGRRACWRGGGVAGKHGVSRGSSGSRCAGRIRHVWRGAAEHSRQGCGRRPRGAVCQASAAAMAATAKAAAGSGHHQPRVRYSARAVSANRLVTAPMPAQGAVALPGAAGDLAAEAAFGVGQGGQDGQRDARGDQGQVRGTGPGPGDQGGGGLGEDHGAGGGQGDGHHQGRAGLRGR